MNYAKDYILNPYDAKMLKDVPEFTAFLFKTACELFHAADSIQAAADRKPALETHAEKLNTVDTRGFDAVLLLSRFLTEEPISLLFSDETQARMAIDLADVIGRNSRIVAAERARRTDEQIVLKQVQAFDKRMGEIYNEWRK